MACLGSWQQQDGRVGHVHQGRFKSLPAQSDDHFLTVARYVERNAYAADPWGKANWGELGELGELGTGTNWRICGNR
ncbi:MAG: hypothetical protein ACPGLY_27735, partial [Rubripirellula sp.]